MIIAPRKHLTYCLNVHPGETWEANMQAITTRTLAIRARIAPDEAFGLGLRLSREAAEQLMDHDTRSAFKAFLERENLYVFTINGFPYGAFHNTRVKEAVYQPDWRTQARVDYTLMLGEILADLLPEGMAGSISTVPGAYRSCIRSQQDRERIATQLGTIAAAFEQQSKISGSELSLGLEPEPDCLIETTEEMIAFMENELLATANRNLKNDSSMPCQLTEGILRRRIGLCLDTCHSAMQFETPIEALEKAHAAGINICKIQISAALKATIPPATRNQLRAFADDVYLHQVRIREKDGTVRRFPDLAPALKQALTPDSETENEWRVHCHVPLDYISKNHLGSTADELTPAFFQQAIQSDIEHLEIETYTFDVLPESMRAMGITTSIANEYKWVLNRIRTPEIDNEA